MLYITKLKLAAVHQLCNHENKSTEYMLEFMQDTCKVNLDCVIAYMKLSDEEHQRLFKEVNNFIELFTIIDGHPHSPK